MQVLIWAMVNDSIDYHELQTGERNEGIVYSTYSFFRKLASAVSGSLSSFVLVPDAVVQQVFQQPCHQRLIHRKHRLLCWFFLFQRDPAVLCQRAFAKLRHQLPEQRPCPEVFPAQGLGTVFQLTGQVQVINEGAQLFALGADLFLMQNLQVFNFVHKIQVLFLVQY